MKRLRRWLRRPAYWMRYATDKPMTRRARRLGCQILVDDYGVRSVFARTTKPLIGFAVADHTNTDLPRGVYGMTFACGQEGAYVKIELEYRCEAILKYEEKQNALAGWRNLMMKWPLHMAIPRLTEKEILQQ